ncbi:MULTISPECIES: hypothetical protein [unclassified Campylobacter]|uniref:hypothetical protein n=1 Tax=unclassified Campylobacter TaxID=2593542 RepID=UPI003D3268DC
MDIKERIFLIDEAIDNVLKSLNDGIEIKTYWIDNIKVEKRSAYELISELRKMKALIILEANQKKNKSLKYTFGGRN